MSDKVTDSLPKVMNPFLIPVLLPRRYHLSRPKAILLPLYFLLAFDLLLAFQFKLRYVKHDG